MTRPRGAPKGNLNAFKHGFYSRLFHAAEAGELTSTELIGLEQEIKLLRVMIRRTMLLADGLDDVREAIRVLDSLGAASARLSALLRVQKSLENKNSQLADDIAIAIKEVNEELRRKK